jgi:hypothetical protein
MDGRTLKRGRQKHRRKALQAKCRLQNPRFKGVSLRVVAWCSYIFPLLITKFYLRHEHLYEKIQEKLIRSDELPDDPGALARSLGDTCIMLSTLSMLSNPTLEGVFEIVPVIQLVVDEASQINAYEFMVRTVLQVLCDFFYKSYPLY